MIRETLGQMSLAFFGSVDGEATLAAPPGTTTDEWMIVVLPMTAGCLPSLGPGFKTMLPTDYRPGRDVADRYLDQVLCYAVAQNKREWKIIGKQTLSFFPFRDKVIGLDVCCLLLAPPQNRPSR